VAQWPPLRSRIEYARIRVNRLVAEQGNGVDVIVRTVPRKSVRTFVSYVGDLQRNRVGELAL